MEPVPENIFSLAYEMAWFGKFRSATNPSVAAIIVWQGKVVCRGVTGIPGGMHAEAEAFASFHEFYQLTFLAANKRAAGALKKLPFYAVSAWQQIKKFYSKPPSPQAILGDSTLVLTLAPCTFTGKTKACLPLVLRSGIKKIILAHDDPHPKVWQKSILQLKNKGIQVERGFPQEVQQKLLYLNFDYFRKTIFSSLHNFDTEQGISRKKNFKGSEYISFKEVFKSSFALTSNLTPSSSKNTPKLEKNRDGSLSKSVKKKANESNSMAIGEHKSNKAKPPLKEDSHSSVLDKQWIDFKKKSAMPACITVKSATTLDGKVATSKNNSKWITSAASRGLARAERMHYDSVLVGGNTFFCDNPKLIAYGIEKKMRDQANKFGVFPEQWAQPRPVVLFLNDATNEELEILQKSHLFKEIFKATPTGEKKSGDGVVFVCLSSHGNLVDFFKKKLLHHAGNYCVVSSSNVTPFAQGNAVATFTAIFRKLQRVGLYSFYCEGGSGLSGLLCRCGIVQRVCNYIAPKILADPNAMGLFSPKNFSEVESMDDAIMLQFSNVTVVGKDVLLQGMFENSETSFVAKAVEL